MCLHGCFLILHLHACWENEYINNAIQEQIENDELKNTSKGAKESKFCASSNKQLPRESHPHLRSHLG